MRTAILSTAAVTGLLCPSAALLGDVLISNLAIGTGTGTSFGVGSSTVYKAAGFTMPAQAYNLDNVKLQLNFASGGTGIYSIWSGVGTPQTQLVLLNSPPQTGSGTFTFTPASPLTLNAGETYWVYVQPPPAPVGSFLWDATAPSTAPSGIATFVGYIFNGATSAFRNKVEVNATPAGQPCYANCDASTSVPVLNVADFTCFLTRFAANEAYANCDASTAEPTLNVADFTCFLTKFAAGCP